jgi:hypothetical protein
MTKQVWFLLLIGALAIGGLLLTIHNVQNGIAKKEKQSKELEIAQDLLSSVMTIPLTNEKVTLTNGRYTMRQGGYIKMGNVITTAGQDIFADFTVNYGGSGDFVSVGMFRDDRGSIQEIAATPLADRVIVTGITAEKPAKDGSYRLLIMYLDRTPTQSMADTPTLEKQKVLTVSGTTMSPSD